MHKLAALVYKAKIGDGHIVDDAINLWTALFNIPLPSWKVWRKDTWSGWWKELKEWFRGSYSHIELWISDEKGKFVQRAYPRDYRDTEWWDEYPGKCYTSSMRGDRPGTVLRPASQVIKDPARWDVGVVCEISDQEYKALMFWIDLTVAENKGYDMLCIADFFNPVRWWWPLHDKNKQICSEAFPHALLIVEQYISDHICSPRRIVRILKKNGVVFTPVTEM